MTKNANIDQCGIIQLLRELHRIGDFSTQELNNIAAKIAVKSGANIIISV